MSKKSISKMLFSNQERVELALIDEVNNLYKKGFDLYDVQSELLNLNL